MRETSHVKTDVSDGELVVDALWGNPDAIAAIYDRHGDEIYDLCWLYLRDREAAGEVTHATLVGAIENLWRLRYPDKLRYWLRAVAQRHAYARARQETPPSSDGTPDDTDATDAPLNLEQHLALRGLLWDDAYGLTDRDQRALSLHLGEQLDGPELAKALDVRPDGCDALLACLRDRVDNTLGALVVARLASSECERLDALLKDWEGAVLARGRIGSHVGACDDCRRRRAIDPWSLLSSVPIVFAPDELRDAVLHDMVAAAANAPAVQASDEPPSDADTAEQAPVRTGRHRMLRRRTGDAAPTRTTDTGAAILSGTARTIIGVLLVVGMTGTAALGFSDLAWVTAVRNGARDLGSRLAGDDAVPPDQDAAERPVAGEPGAPGGSDAETTAGGSDGTSRGAPSRAAARPDQGDALADGQLERPSEPVAFVPLPLAIVPGSDASDDDGAAGDRVAAADGDAPLVPFVDPDDQPSVTPVIPSLPDVAIAPEEDDEDTATPTDADSDDGDTSPSTLPGAAGAALGDAGDLARDVTRQVERAVPAAPAANAAAAADEPATAESAAYAGDGASSADESTSAPDSASDEDAPARESDEAEPETSTIRAVLNALLASLQSSPAEDEAEPAPAAPEPAPGAPADDAEQAIPAEPAAERPEPVAVPAPDDESKADPEPAPADEQPEADPAPAPDDDARKSDDDARRKAVKSSDGRDDWRDSRRTRESHWSDDDRRDRHDGRYRRGDGRDDRDGRDGRHGDRRGDRRGGGFSSFFSRMMAWRR